MRVVSCSQFGPVDQLAIEERPDAACGSHDVRIAVAAAGVNFVDALLVLGRYQIKPALPFVPGSEIAGRVLEVGSEVSHVATGDRVFANVGQGGYASEVVIGAARVRPTPDQMSDAQAATFMQSYGTAWFSLHHRAGAVAGHELSPRIRDDSSRA